MDNNPQLSEKDPYRHIELHHREVTDLLGDAPYWLIHSGSYMLYIILTLLLSGAAFISYPDVVQETVLIDDLANAEWITANSSGQIEAFFVENDAMVKRGDTIAILHNPAQLNDVKKFCRILTNVEQYYRTNNTDLLREFRFDLIMGEMSDAYENFTNAVRNCMIHDDHHYFDTRNSFLLKELAILKKEPEKNELAILNTDRTIFELSISHSMEVEKNRKQLELAYVGMVNAIRTWESKYLIQSHSNGRIALGEVRLLTRIVNKGDTIGSVVSNNRGEYVAHMQLDQEQVAGVEIGNTVNIRLAKYPAHTYGMLTGEVNAITFVPYNKQYIVDIRFNDRLLTTAKKEIKYELGLKGEASIITASRSVLSRIFNPIFALFGKDAGEIKNSD